MAGQPRPLFPGTTPARKDWGMWFVNRSGETVLLLARFFKLTRSIFSPAFLPSRHFDPFGTEFSVKPGQANHSLYIYKELSSFRRSSRRPRARRDFTVPILICSAAAISS
jgi:hypothetical protein